MKNQTVLEQNRLNALTLQNVLLNLAPKKEMKMALKIYNSLTRKKETFKPLKPGKVNIYVCGPTVYSHAHIGHAKSYISFDIVVRYFRYLGYRVKYVQNITDVGHLVGDSDEGEDKIQKKARQEQIDPVQIAQTFTWSYFDDMDALGITRPDISPQATGHVIEQIELVKILIDKGYAYESNGSVYFDVSNYPQYGKLSGRKVEEMESGARVMINPEKRHPADFALWKKANPGHLMKWPSPWSVGYPGWHIECSVMSMKYLGDTFDIHGGGLDNVFPHHECEIAQSEAATGKPLARFWMHNNTLTINGEKMSKSLGNVVNIKDLLKQYSRNTIRYFMLSSHYRSRLDFSESAIKAAGQGLSRLTASIGRLQTAIDEAGNQDNFKAPFSIEDFRNRFQEAMNDDFNTAKAIAVLFDLSKVVNQYLSNQPNPQKAFLEEIKTFFQKVGTEVLGIISQDTTPKETGIDHDIIDKLIEMCLQIRNDLRSRKNWELADQVRDKLNELGIIIEDRPDGATGWSKK